MLTRLGRWGRARAAGATPFTDVYGVARTLLALGTLGTLVFTHSDVLFSAGMGEARAPFCAGPARASLFCLVPREGLEAARWAAAAALAVVATGWRPRWTAVPHWWIAWSVMSTVSVLDGGDQVTAILTLLLAPVALLDARRWHWASAPEGGGPIARLAARSCFLAMRLQVAAIYFHAAIGKLRVPEWADGTALHYWFTHPGYGMAGWLRPVMVPLLLHPVAVTVLTWSVLLVEILLFTGLLMDPRRRPALLGAGLAFHAGIAVVHGLVSFAAAMCAALLLFLWPPEREIGVARRVSRRRTHAPAPRPAAAEEAEAARVAVPA